MTPTLLSRWAGPAFAGLLPGLLLVALITAAAFGLRGLPGFASLSPVILAIVLGIFFANAVGLPEGVQPGIAFASRTLLRAAVALLGAQITLGELTAFGWEGVAGVLAVVLVTLPLTYALGRLMGIERDLAMLVAAGTSICGASAIAGANAVLRARDEFVAYAVAVITIWGTLGLFLLPLLQSALGLSEGQLGVWAGLSLHEVAQAVGAGFAAGEVSGQAAVAMKLGRVLMLGAVIFALARLWRARDGAEAPAAGVPGFVLAFLGLAGLNSLGLVPEGVRQLAAVLTPLMLAAALAGLGLSTHFARLRLLGLRPLVLGGISFALIAGLGFGLARLVG